MLQISINISLFVQDIKHILNKLEINSNQTTHILSFANKRPGDKYLGTPGTSYQYLGTPGSNYHLDDTLLTAHILM